MSGTGPDRRARTVSWDRSMERSVPTTNAKIEILFV